MMKHPYSTEVYAHTLRHIGRPVAVPEWECSVLARPISDGGEDIVGCYPIATLSNCSNINDGLKRLQDMGFVSATLIVDDFHRPSLNALEASFGIVRPFKSHFLHTGGIANYQPSHHHRYEIRRALDKIEASPVELSEHMNAWLKLYTGLSERHQLGEAHAFSPSTFAALADMTGVETIGGFYEGEMVSCHIWVRDRDTVHSHLAASSPLGYEKRAAYAVNDVSVRHFADCRIVNFGGSAGIGDDPTSGLARFKKGFSNTVASSYLCGAILNHEAYHALSSVRSGDGSSFFPAYRAR